MRKIFKTIVVASLATLAMPLSASTMQTYTASSDSIDTTVEPADTLREKLAQMETRMASMEQEQETQKTWKRRKYWKIGITSPNLERTDGEEMKWKTKGSFFIQKGRHILPSQQANSRNDKVRYRLRIHRRHLLQAGT